jgi:hypothetical protein
MRLLPLIVIEWTLFISGRTADEFQSANSRMNQHGCSRPNEVCSVPHSDCIMDRCRHSAEAVVDTPVHFAIYSCFACAENVFIL